MALPKLHASTVVFLVLVAAGLLLANIPGQIVEGPVIDASGQWGPDLFRTIGDMFHHGWPFTFLVREPAQSAAWPPPLPTWNLGEGVIECSWWRMTADILIGLLLFFVAGAAFERWRRRRGRFQLQLIDMFVASTLVACCLAYWATQAKEHNRQEQSAERLPSPIGLFDLPQWSSGGPTWLRDLLDCFPLLEDRPLRVCDRVIKVEITGAGLMHLSDLRNLKSVFVAPSALSNQQLDALRELPELEALELSNAAISEEDRHTLDEEERHPIRSADPYIRLPAMPHLRGLNLYQAAFRGDGLEHLTGIEVLDLSYTEVGDDAMPKFEAMRNLRSVSLAGTKITDAGLEHLKGLTQLRELSLKDTKVTAEAIKRLQQALPNCKIESRSIANGKG
jgi:hypothetical protein